MRYVLEPGIKEDYAFICQHPGCDNLLRVTGPFYSNSFLGLTGARAGARKEKWRKTKKGWVCPDHEKGKP